MINAIRQGIHYHPVSRSHPHREGVNVIPRSGDVVLVAREASVQFASPMLFRVIRVHDWPTYDGWAWLDGYQLNASGDAVDRRSIFVQVGGLRPAPIPINRRKMRQSAPGRRDIPARVA